MGSRYSVGGGKVAGIDAAQWRRVLLRGMTPAPALEAQGLPAWRSTSLTSAHARDLNSRPGGPWEGPARPALLLKFCPTDLGYSIILMFQSCRIVPNRRRQSKQIAAGPFRGRRLVPPARGPMECRKLVQIGEMDFHRVNSGRALMASEFNAELIAEGLGRHNMSHRSTSAGKGAFAAKAGRRCPGKVACLRTGRLSGRKFTVAQIKQVAAAVRPDVTFQRHGDYTLAASKVLALLNAYVAERIAGRDVSTVAWPGTPFGPTSPVVRLTEPATTDGSQFRRTVVDVADYLRTHGRVPTAVWLGSTAVPPEAYLQLLARVALELADGKPVPKTLEVIPARFAAAAYVADDRPEIWRWPIFPPGFRRRP